MDDYTPPSRARTVNTLFANLEHVLLMLRPASAQQSLGVHWSFGLPAQPSAFVREYGVPLCRGGFLSLLSDRGGVTVTARTLAVEPTLASYMASSGRPAIVAVDSFHLPYRPAYGRVHSGRTIIVAPNGDGGEPRVIDAWPPVYDGLLSWAHIDRARRSTLEADPRREPIFAGWRIDGEWFAVEPGLATSPTPTSEQLLERLATLHSEATEAYIDHGDHYGIEALRELTWRRPSARETSLLLRAELSARVYLCAFLRVAARELGDGFLAAAVGRYYRMLGHMEAARDVLAKSVAHPRPEYDAFIRRRLASAIAAEEALAAVLEAYA